MILGAFVQGITVTGRKFGGGPFDWLNAFSVMTGIALVAGYALLGSTWLILKTEDVGWDILTPDALDSLKETALDPENYNKKAKQQLFEYAMVYHCTHYLEPLAALSREAASGRP